MRTLFSIVIIVSAIQLQAGEFIVRLRPNSKPLPQWTKAQLLTPELAVSAKYAETTMSIDQQKAVAEMLRYVVVSVDGDSNVERLKSIDGVELVFQNRTLSLHSERITDDSLSAEQYALQRIGAPTAWRKATGKNVVVGVVDTGIDWEHLDLVHSLAVSAKEDINGSGRFEAWPSTIERDGVSGDLNDIDDDENGYTDDVIGFDFVDQHIRNLGDDRTRDPIPFDEQGHGTSVAGVICAEANNKIGIAGLAFDARVVSMRAFDATGNAEEDDIAAALVYAAVNGVDVVNMSFGDGVDSPVLRDAIRLAAAYGCVLVASAGNSGTTSRQFPAGYDDVIAVAATNEFDERSAFSSTGSIVDLSAPGEAIITTRVGGGYRRVNGTSFSAPYVAAAAALLIEHFGTIEGQAVRSMLQEASLDLGDKGWDPLFGAGRLQADVALDLPAQSLVEITSPMNEQEISTSIGTLDIIGSTQALLFDGYSVEIGRGAEPISWMGVVSSAHTAINALLVSLDVSAFVTSDYVVRLKVNLKDGRTLEERKRIRVVNDDTLKITGIEVVNAWNNDRRVAVLSVSTNRPTYLMVDADWADSSRDMIVDQRRFTRKHSIPIDPSPWATFGTLHFQCIAGTGDTVSSSVPFNTGEQAMPTTGATVKSSAPFAGYVLNDVRDVYNNGTQTFVMNDLGSGGFGPMLTVQPNGFEWGYQDSTSDVWIPRGMGDANGNGKLEVFAHVVGRAKLFEASTVGGNPFATSIFLDDVGRNNAAGMADIDGDGKEELLMLSDSGCVVVSYRSGRFERLGIALNPSAAAPGNFSNRVDEISVAAGDFDGDGNIEIAFSDTDGDLVISQYANGAFTTEFVFEGGGAGGSGYVASGDVDNDGKPDILLGVPDSTEPNADGEYGRQVWTYRLFRSTIANEYQVNWTDYVYGVRYGLGYRSGVEIDQVDMKDGDEIIICAFPRLFVLKWKDGTVQPLYYRADAVSPRFLVHDFDRNGHNEIGFGKTEPELGFMTSFQFIEIQEDESRIATPAGINAISTGAISTLVSWMPVKGATGYRVFLATSDDGLFRAIDTVQIPRFATDTLNPERSYSFRVSALSDTLKESFRSSVATVNAGKMYGADRIVKNVWTRSEFERGVQFRVFYDGKLMTGNIDPTAFIVTDSADRILTIGRTATTATDSDVVVTCFPLRQPFTGTRIDIHTTKIYDARGIPTMPRGFLGSVVSDTVVPELYLSRLNVLDPSHAQLTYSEVVGESALHVNSYTLLPVGTIAAIDRVNDSTVSITFASDPPLAALGKQYSITVRNVVSASGNPITLGAGNTLSFVITKPDLEDVFVYPQPALLSSNDYLTFANLTQQAEIEVLDQRFKTVVKIKEVDGNGGARWDMRDETGALVPPGMYFYRVTGANETQTDAESGLRKLMIRR